MSSVAETVLRLESHCQIPDSDLNKPALAMIPEKDRAEFVARCAENKKRYEALRGQTCSFEEPISHYSPAEGTDESAVRCGASSDCTTCLLCVNHCECSG